MTGLATTTAWNRRLACLAATLATTFGCRPAQPPGAVLPLAVFGQSGMGPGEFNYPRAVALHPDGRIYVVDKAGRIQALDQSGVYALGWEMPEIQQGKPVGLGIAPDGQVYVADTHYSRVIVFSADGRRLASFGEQGDGPGQFRLPTDVVVDGEGNIFVGEYGGNDRISKFSPRWEYLFSFGGPDAGAACLQRPQTLVLGADGTLWVADACNHRICRFAGDGRFLGHFGRPGRGVGELWFPYGLDLLSDGTLVVCEYGNNRVQRFDVSRWDAGAAVEPQRLVRSLGVWGAAGRKPGQLAYPWAVIAGRDDRVFVIDSGNNRVQVIAGGARATWRVNGQ